MIIPQRMNEDGLSAISVQYGNDRMAVNNWIETTEIKTMLGFQADEGLDAFFMHV